jgi:hypothetical protein
VEIKSTIKSSCPEKVYKSVFSFNAVILYLKLCQWPVMIGLVGLVVALRPQTPKHIRDGWSHYTDTREPVDGGVL